MYFWLYVHVFLALYESMFMVHMNVFWGVQEYICWDT